MKLKQRKSRNKPDAGKSQSPAQPKPTATTPKSPGIREFIAEQATKKRGVTDRYARKGGTRAL